TDRRELIAIGAAGAVAFAIGLANLVVLYRGVLPLAALAPAIAIAALGYGACVSAYADLARRTPILAAFTFAAAWTSLEWLAPPRSPHGTAASIAYSQADVPAMIGLAAFTGQYGITFALCLVPAAIAAFLADRRRPAPLSVAIATIIVVV